MHADEIRLIEEYARGELAGQIAHEFAHVDRVRGWALRVARAEGFARLDLVAAAALLHDVGLRHVAERRDHARAGAERAAAFLRENGLFPEPEIAAIAEAIRCHSSLGGGGELGAILRDADMLDMFGAVGLMRAMTSTHAKPEYDPANVRGETCGLRAGAFTARFAAGQGVGPTIVDQLNFQLSCADNLSTPTARQLAQPLLTYMRQYLLQLEAEVGSSRT